MSRRQSTPRRAASPPHIISRLQSTPRRSASRTYSENCAGMTPRNSHHHAPTSAPAGTVSQGWWKLRAARGGGRDYGGQGDAADGPAHSKGLPQARPTKANVNLNPETLFLQAFSATHLLACTQRPACALLPPAAAAARQARPPAAMLPPAATLPVRWDSRCPRTADNGDARAHDRPRLAPRRLVVPHVGRGGSCRRRGGALVEPLLLSLLLWLLLRRWRRRAAAFVAAWRRCRRSRPYPTASRSGVTGNCYWYSSKCAMLRVQEHSHLASH